MKRYLIVLAAALSFASPALASDTLQGDLHIMAPWSRPLPAVSVNGAAYMTLMNMGSEADTLIAISTPAAKKAELHNHTMEGGLMKMRRVESIEIAPGTPIVLEPGGLHVMLMGLTEPLVDGKSFPLTLEFQRAGSVEIEVMINEPGEPGHGHMKHDMKKQGG